MGMLITKVVMWITTFTAKAVVEKPHIYVNNFVDIHGISLISTPKL